jgi:heavy metal sensor kinase
MLKTIRAKIGLLTGVFSLVILLGFGFYLYFSLRLQLYQSIDERLQSRLEQLLSAVEIEDRGLVFDPEASAIILPDDDTARLVSLSGAVLEQRGDEGIPLISPSEVDEKGFLTIRMIDEVDHANDEREFETFRILNAPVIIDGDLKGYLQIGRGIDWMVEALSRLLMLLIVAGPVLVGIATAGGYLLAGQALDPIERIRQRAASIHAKDLSQRLELTTTDDEVGRLAQTFNEMLDRLDGSFRRQRRFTADASHELRTPLSVIRGEIDIILERPRKETEYIETLESVGVEAQRMSRLVHELLLLARADTDEFRLEREKINLADLLCVLIEQMERQAQEAEVTLQIDLPTQLPVFGDRDRLLELFINLLENSFSHAPGSLVSVRALSNGENILVSITDTGPGIAKEHLPHLFDRFYRVDPSRKRSVSGSGLGLAIAQEIANAHGGGISVQSEPGRGTTFTVRLPMSPSKHRKKNKL